MWPPGYAILTLDTGVAALAGAIAWVGLYKAPRDSVV